jgi:hypothetical protein
MFPFRVPDTGPVACPFMFGGRWADPDPIPPPAEGGPPVFCAHADWKEMAIPIANAAKLRIRMLTRMAAPPFR